MIAALVLLAVLALVVAGIAALARERTMTDEEYEERRGRGAGVGGAVLALHEILEPGRAEAGKAREERPAEPDPGGDPPETGPGGLRAPAPPRRPGP
jgi:hypothetical protein